MTMEEYKMAIETPDEPVEEEAPVDFTVIPKEHDKEEAAACNAEGGDWIEYPTTCTGTCATQVAREEAIASGEGLTCGQGSTDDCACGEGKCWDRANQTCITLDEYKEEVAASEDE